MMNPLPFFKQLEQAKRILISGAGGGFDIFCGLPLYFHLRDQGKEVFLANLTFSNITTVKGERLTPVVLEVNANSNGSESYFPEKHLCRWFEKQNEAISLYCFERTGVVPLAEAYQVIIGHLSVDTVILVDGGTDSLMRGDEAGLGTPSEDILSIASAYQLKLERKYLLCLGFGVDAFHGVCHAHFLRAVAELIKEKAFYGAFSLLESMPEVQKYKAAMEFVFKNMPESKSIVNSSILLALEGEYGNSQQINKAWINPLISLYWAFELNNVAERVLYLEWIIQTQTFADIVQQIESFRRNLGVFRRWESIPV